MKAQVSNMINNTGWKGKYEIYINRKLEAVIDNRIMDAALDEFAKVLQGDATDLEIKYLAVGTDDTAVTDSDTQLGAEIFRTAVASQSKTDTGEVTTEFVILENEAINTIEEIGIFAGSTAGAGANTGTLISRILWHKVKLSTMELNIKRIDRMVR